MKNRSLGKSFSNAFSGILIFFANDRNGRIHLAAAIWVSIGGIYFAISLSEWAILLLCMGFVICMEMINHSLEKVCDSIHTSYHPLVKAAKDVAAAAVLCSAIISAIIGLLIFVPKISALV